MGYNGNGLTCVDVSECMSSPYDRDTICTNLFDLLSVFVTTVMQVRLTSGEHTSCSVFATKFSVNLELEG